MLRRFVIAALLASATAAANDLVVTTPQRTTGAGVSTQLITVQRRIDAGTATALTVTVASNSPTGQYNDLQQDGTGWSVSGNTTLNFAAGELVKSFSYRDPTAGVFTLDVSAAGYAGTNQNVNVEMQLIHDDFEGPILFSQTPAGQWHSAETRTGTSLGNDGGAAHRGTYGLRCTDSASDLTVGAESRVILYAGAVSPQAFFRGWFKSSGAAGGVATTVFIVSNDQGRPVLEGSIEPTGFLSFATRDTTGNRLPLSTDAGVAPNQWMLIEAQVSGLGTPTGQARFWVDGRPVASQINVDQTGRALGATYLGVAWQDPSLWTGTVDWDDVVLSKNIVPDAVMTYYPAPAWVGQCAPAYAEALSNVTGGGGAFAPYDLAVHVDVGDAGTVHQQPDCTDGPVNQITINRGSMQRLFYVRPLREGSLLTRTWHEDMLTNAPRPSLDVLTATQPDAGAGDAGVDGGLSSQDGGTNDGGQPDGGGASTDGGLPDDAGSDGGAGPVTLSPLDLNVGCGCGEAPSLVFAGGLLISALFVRRRR